MSWAKQVPKTVVMMSCLLAVGSTAYAGSVASSSSLKDSDGVSHTASKAFDGLLSTSWAEDERGDGEGTWVEVRLDQTTEVSSVSIWPGNLVRGTRSVREASRPKRVTVVFSGGPEGEVEVEKRVLDPVDHGLLRTDLRLDEPVKARTVRIRVDEVYTGGLRSDLYIAEIAINFARGDAPAALTRHQTWLESDAGARGATRNKEDVAALMATIQASDFGDRDSLQELMSRASDGAPYVRRRIVSSVPAGFRVQALPPDADALDALIALEDGNALPALEQAALRVKGEASRRLKAKASYFSAKQDLVGGGRRNIKAFGETGWERGALQGRGEPLSIVVDPFARIYVADTGNHRVQQYSDAGVSENVWGFGAAGVTPIWFSKKGAFYAAGNAPSDASGGFLCPLAMTRVPGRVSDTIVVLDAAGRVSFLDPDGGVRRVVQLDTATSLEGGLGGEGYLVQTKKALVAIWGNEGFVLTPEGEPLSSFELADGVPSAAVALSNGKLGLAYGRALIQYGLDGYRFGDLFDGVLGRGFEAWDVTLDDAGKMWVITDRGVVTKFKRPGKIDFQLELGAYSFEMPRMAVLDEVLYITTKDAVVRVDVLEQLAQLALSEADAS